MASNNSEEIASNRFENGVGYKVNSMQFKENEDTSKSIRSLLDETLVYRDKIRNFLERRAYVFKTPLDELPSHPSFQREFINIENGVCKGFVPAIDGREVLTEVSGAKANLPPRGELKRKELKAGTFVWAMKTNFIEQFVQGRVLGLRDGDLYEVRVYDRMPPKLYNARQLAYRERCNVVIPVGTRIIARVYDGMFAGITGELPTSTNRKRYLIFFDDGYTQYIGHEDIHVVCSQSKDVSIDLAKEFGMFIRLYLAKFPEIPKQTLRKNQRITVELNSSWLHATVLEVDCSMVKVKFDSGLVDVIYRGSMRLKLLYDKLVNVNTTGKRNLFMKNPPYAEYSRDNVTIDSDDRFAEVWRKFSSP